MVLLGSTFWGLSGTASQVLFQHDHVHAAWLVTVRMLFSGIILVIWGTLRRQPASRSLITNRSLWPKLLVFSIVGLVGVQITYFKAIADGNAAAATLLQYLGPPLIVAYAALRERRLPNRTASFAMILALFGTVLLITGGRIRGLEVPLPAILWGIMSALCLAFYTLYPVPLIRRYDTVAVVGWGMLLGGAASIFIGPVWAIEPASWSVSLVLLTAFVVLLGTLAAFSLYLASLHYLTPSETGLFATAEPISAVVASLLFLHVRLDKAALLGAIAIMAAIVMLSRTTVQHPDRDRPLPS